MKRRVLCLVTAGTLGLSMLPISEVWCATPGPGTTPAKTVLTVENDILFAFLAEPEYHLRRAQAYLQKNDFPEATQELETVRAFVRLERARAEPPAVDKLIDALIELGAFTRASKKSTATAKGLARVALLVHLALANHTQQMAQASWADKAWQVTGQHLYGAELHLRQGLAWSDQVLKDEQQNLLKENAVLAKALMEGSGCGNSWAEEAAAPQIAAMRQLLEAVWTPTSVAQ